MRKADVFAGWCSGPTTFSLFLHSTTIEFQTAISIIWLCKLSGGLEYIFMCATGTMKLNEKDNKCYITFSYKPENFTCKGTLDVGSKISQHDHERKKAIEHTSCKNASTHRCLGAVEVFFYRHDHFFPLLYIYPSIWKLQFWRWE